MVHKDPALKEKHVKNQGECKKVKMGMRISFSYLAKSKYLLCIGFLVIGFNIVINMIEIIWKDQISFIYPTPNDFNAYIGKVLKWLGFLSTFIAIFVSGNMIRKMGWTFSALITPVALLITGVFFFGILLFKENPLLVKWSAILGFTPLALGVFFGTVQNVFSRACKYTLFDATKEISFIPLSSESKFKGKAAIDGVGSRLGKTGGSIIHGFLLMLFGSVSLSTPFVGIFVLLVVLGWIAAVQSLGRQFNRLTKQDEKLEINEEQLTPAQDGSTQRVSTT